MFRYELIAGQIKNHIESGNFPDNRLPSERALMQRFDVQRNTIRRSLALLQADGLIATEKNRRPLILAKEASGLAVHPRELKRLTGSVVLVVEKIEESTARFDIEQGLRQAFSESGLSILYFDSAQAPLSRGGLPSDEYLEDHNAAGLVVWPMPPIDTGSLRQMRRKLPIVLVDRRVLGFETDFVGFDDERGGRIVARHLLSKGRRRIGFLSGEIGAETVEGRWRGYRNELEEAGIHPDPAWALQIANLRKLQEPILHGYLETFVSQSGSAPLDAVFCASDSTAANLIHFLRVTGRRLPDDVAVVGYGDLLPDYLRAIGLTTMAQKFADVGFKAGAIMLRRLSLPRSASIPYEEIRLPVRLVERNSC